jgi:uncharacterized protein
MSSPGFFWRLPIRSSENWLCLRVGDYRFSEDLDFTLISKATSTVLLSHLEGLLDRLAEEERFQFAVPMDRVEERETSLTAYINFVGPLQARLDSRHIKVDLTLSEKVIFPIVPRAVRSDYSDGAGRRIAVYSLEEVLVEKLCAIIGRTEPRDIYDAHFLFGLKGIDFVQIPAAFAEKAEFKGIDPARLTEVGRQKSQIGSAVAKAPGASN